MLSKVNNVKEQKENTNRPIGFEPEHLGINNILSLGRYMSVSSLVIIYSANFISYLTIRRSGIRFLMSKVNNVKEQKKKIETYNSILK